jgi:hypothetical protein
MRFFDYGNILNLKIIRNLVKLNSLFSLDYSIIHFKYGK